MSRHEFVIAGDTHEVSLEKTAGGFKAVNGETEVEITDMGAGRFAVLCNGTRLHASAAAFKGVTYVEIDSQVFELREPSDDSSAAGGGDHDTQPDKIFAPMPGKIVKLMVKVGDQVLPKQQAVIVEAMKMENPVLTRAAGKVKAVNFAEGDQVDTERPIIELELES